MANLARSTLREGAGSEHLEAVIVNWEQGVVAESGLWSGCFQGEDRNKDDVEDIYPCSPMQEGLLLSQLRDPNAYMFHTS
jgi:hypothetical protein